MVGRVLCPRQAFCVTLVAALVLAAASLRAAEPPATVSLTRGPYLQLLGTDTVTVVWNTDRSAQCVLHIRPLGGGPGRAIAGGTGRVCAITAGGLYPGARYAYTPRAGETGLAAETIFRTDDPWRPFTFLVVGDSGDGSEAQYRVARQMRDSPADLIVHTGDMVYPEGKAGDFDPYFFTPYRDIIRRLVFWPTLGEQDTLSDSRRPWSDAFYTPANNHLGAEEYYSFDYGNAHFVVLDTTHSSSPGSRMYDFLEADLAASRATWNFVFLHKPLYSSRVGPTSRRDQLVPVLDEYGVDFVFQGDMHVYERTKPLHDDRIVDADEGTVYVTTGGGGRSTGPAVWTEITAYTESTYHFTRLAVDGNELVLQMVRDNGSVGDTLRLSKGKPQSCGDQVVNHRGERCDGPDDRECPGACRSDCTCPPACGDGMVNRASEECDGAADTACPGRCLSDCVCAIGPAVIEIEPVADTYLDSDVGAGWDHGAASELEIDAVPERLAYFKFDLSWLDAPVVAASLTLHCTDSTNDGGTLFPVDDAGWIEGDRNGRDGGSAGGAGLVWLDVDTNDDGEIGPDDASPYVPDFGRPLASLGSVGSGHPVRVELTPVFQAGPGVYSFALRTNSSSKGAFASREARGRDERPRLRLELAPSPPCEVGPDCADGNPCTSQECHPISGTCLFEIDHSICDNGFYCDGVERCDVENGCLEGAPIVCDDAVACTLDRCDGVTKSCGHEPQDPACDDGDECTTDRCDARDGCRYTESGLCEFPGLDLTAVADTFIEAGGEASWDHGAASEVEVDASPLRITYLRFDPGPVTLPVAAATLTLHVTDGTGEGGTIHPVADSSWVEGVRTGLSSASAGGPGLKWNDVDTNRDGRIDAADTSPFVPDLATTIATLGDVDTGEVVRVDVTDAFRTGAGVRTFAIRTPSTNRGAYASREQAGRAPRLRLDLRCAADGDCDDGFPCTVDTCDGLGRCVHAPADARCDDGDLCTEDRCEPATRACTHIENGLCEPVVLELGAAGDTYIEAGAEAGWDHGATPLLKVDASPRRLVYVKFDTSAVTGPITNATLTLHCTDPAPDGGTLYPVPDASWIEGTRAGASGPGLTWNDVDTNRDGAIGPADASPWVPELGRPIASLGSVAAGDVIRVDVTSALRTGVALQSFALVNTSTNGAFYGAREATDVALRPTLRVTMPATPPCASDADCDDALECTIDRCTAGVCSNTGDDARCDDGVACTVDRCDPSAGGCVYAPDDGACDNGVFCDGPERCEATLGCRPAAPVVCDDGLACTLDACDEAGDRCTHVPQHLLCDDGDRCTTDRCDTANGCEVEPSGLCAPLILELEAAGDTFVEAGAQATWDHGAADLLKVDRDPRRLIYLKFDLTDVPGPIESAALVLHCTDYSPDGGTLYPVADSTWVEGNRTGADSTSAAGPGLRWVDVDTDRDGFIGPSDTSPYVPDFGRPLATLGTVQPGQTLTLDVTAALRSGAAVYTLALRNEHTNGAFYASRNAVDPGRRPRLRLVVPPAAACGTAADCDDGVPCTLDACDAGTCRHVAADERCDDGLACTRDVCDTAAGACRHVTDDAPCDDGRLCNGAEVCDATLGCVAGTPVVCDDGIACTADGCEEGTGGCVHDPRDAACDDGDPCTTDACSATAGCGYTPSGLCGPAVLDLDTIADTYIQAGAEATWDHGAADLLKVDADPQRITYLKFDLSAAAGEVTRAVLTLHCTDLSPDGGTLYPVSDAGWIEGDRTGAAGGPGLRWVDVDTNADGRIDAADRSPYVPDFSRPLAAAGSVDRGQAVTFDVTAALQGGPRIYALALRTGASNGAFYASREGASALRPRLRVEFSRAPGCTTDPQCDDGIPCTIDRCVGGACTSVADNAGCDDGDPCTSDSCEREGCRHTESGLCAPLQIDLAPAADTYVEAGARASWDHGAADLLKVDTDPPRIVYLKFDLSAVRGAVTRARLVLSCTDKAPDGGTLYPVTDSSWMEGDRTGSAGGPGLTWTQLDTNRDGRISGADTSPYVPDFTRPIASVGSIGSGEVRTLDVTAAFQTGPGLYTLALTNTTTNGAFYASREAASALRPVLRLDVSALP